MVAYEQLLERDALYLFEFSPQVKAFREQPPKFFYADGGKVRRYTADFELTLPDGSLLLIEVKPTRSLKKNEVQAKLDVIGDAMARQGHQFIVLTEKIIRVEPRLGNLKILFPYLCQPIPAALCLQLRQIPHLANPKAPILMQELIEHLGSRANVLRLLAHGLIGFDCMQPITLDSQIVLFPEEVDHVGIDWI
ncbi:TnsA endonuclease N-terminal domain-containing protein [Chromobacterium violaceum]|uniref:TnsA endonuclease N-terminal domain-containing protein n=1 Tax=Chromobacterium violaceum TaxID=536 RepID=UPI001B3448E6|nr:TnsA endonuclease N-terminal domain-containing protein [Chromobacterium violaceum]MBP4051626.1 TnsA endonuclease N-terminal domain-containing protein [Chromobacterium violaceum]